MNKHTYYKIGCVLFFTGIFILPSTLFLGAIFLLSLSLFPKSKVINTIFISYILGVYDFLRGRKEGTYKPVNN